MYEIIAGLFILILLTCIYAIIKYGFNMIFLYILLFSLVVILWTIIVIIEDRKESKNEAK
jgi:4-hydroxybenzoate polyprenyltransferase